MKGRLCCKVCTVLCVFVKGEKRLCNSYISVSSCVLRIKFSFLVVCKIKIWGYFGCVRLYKIVFNVSDNRNRTLEKSLELEPLFCGQTWGPGWEHVWMCLLSVCMCVYACIYDSVCEMKQYRCMITECDGLSNMQHLLVLLGGFFVSCACGESENLK